MNASEPPAPRRSASPQPPEPSPAPGRATAPRVALVGDRSDLTPAHPRLDALASALPVRLEWVASEDVRSAGDLTGFDGVWVVPGSPYASRDGVLTAIRHAREDGVPFLGTCGGFQHALIEYLRHVAGIAEADDVQYDPDAALPVIAPLACSLKGEHATLRLTAGSRLSAVYGGALESTELFHCQYGLNPDFAGHLGGGDLRISAWDGEGTPRAVELPRHAFYVGTLFQPELSSVPGAVHPLIEAFTAAVLQHATTRGGTDSAAA